MLHLVTKPFSQEEWTEIVSGFHDLNLIQTWEYAEAKSQTGPWKVERAAFVDNERVVGAVQALVRPIPSLQRRLVWINRGPLWRRSENEEPLLLVAMMEGLLHHWVSKRRMYLRIAPCSYEGKFDVKALEKIGYCLDKSVPGWASARIDLSSPIASLRKQLHQKWRNCLNKAERLGLVLQSGCDDSLFDEFLAEYRQMLLARKYVTSMTPHLLSRLQTLLPRGRKLWVVAGRKDGQSLGAVLIARYGVTCEYLASAINDCGRTANAGQLLLWRAICEMKDCGYRWLDLGGLDPQQTPSGIFHFKAGLGGVPYRLIGEIEALEGGGWLSQIIRWRVSRARQAASAEDKAGMKEPLRYRLVKAWPWGRRALRWVFERRSGGGFQALIFHNVPREQMGGFERLLRYVLDVHGTITPGEAEAFLAKQELPALNNRTPCLLTFDDGFRSHVNVAREILDRYGVKAIFFVCPGLIDIPRGRQCEAITTHIFDGDVRRTNLPGEMALMSWADLEALTASGHTIGSHTTHHRRLSMLGANERQQEIIESAELLQSRLGVSVRWFAYPFGDIQSIDRNSLEAIARRYAFCCSGIRGVNSAGTHPLGLLREPLDLTSPFEYQKFILKGGWDFYYCIKARSLRELIDKATVRGGSEA